MKNLMVIIVSSSKTLKFFKGQIKFLSKYFRIELISSYDNYLKDIASEEGVSATSIEIKREISIFHDLLSLIKLYKFFIKKKPSVIHGNTPKAALLSLLAGWMANIPTRIYFLHGLRYEGFTGPKRQLLILFEKISCYFATNIYAVGFGIKKEMQINNITKKPIRVIGHGSINGVDLEYFNKDNLLISNANLFAPKSFIYGYIGRINKDKGINELIQAFLEINNVFKNTKLLLVGEFEDELNPIKKEFKEEILHNQNIKYIKYKDDVRPYLKIIDVFVMPSHREGFGLSLLEAMSMNTASIASNISGCNELITHKKNGLLFLMKDVSSLFEKMKLLYTDNELRHFIRSNSRKIAEEKFRKEDVWKKTMKELKDICKS